MNKKRKKVHAPTIFAMVVFVVSLIFFTNTAKPAQAATYNWYFSQDGCDEYAGSCGTYGDGSIGDPWKSLRKLEEQINSITNGTDSATAYLKRGDTWTLASDSDCIQIKRSNVTIDAYGSGAKPIFDGAGAYPTGVNTYVISVAGDTVMVSNTTIRNLKIQNTYPGQGIIFNGGDGNLCSGPGLVEYVDGYMLGGNVAYIYKVANSSGSSGAIKIEHCSANKCGEAFRRGAVLWGTCAIGTDYYSSGHEVRYNTVWDMYGEGLDIIGAAICEYNIVSDTQSGAIYYEPGGNNAGQCIIRYNLIWDNSSGLYHTGTQIRVDDEVASGSNAASDIQIYGNIIIGGNAGIDLRNNPFDVPGSYSNWGSIKVYNNTLIDNEHNFVVGTPERFTGPVIIKNNASIINSDSELDSEHISYWGEPIGSAFTIGPNFFYGDSTTSNTDLITAFQSANNVFGTEPPLPKTSNWRNLTSLDDFSFADFYPAETSQLVNRTQTDQISGYDQYLTTGTNWETLPDNEDFVLADQDSQGADWDFGAIINSQAGGDVTPPTAPSGLSVE